MRTLIALLTTIPVLIGYGVAQAQNIAKVCDAECALRLQQSISDLQQRVRALEQASEDWLTTRSVGLPGPDVSAFTYIPDPSTLTPYVWVLSCQHHEQTGMVPSEGGGTRQITVRRC
jgi:hypothetical protein